MTYFGTNLKIKPVKGPDKLSIRKTLISSFDDKLQIIEYHNKSGSVSKRHKHPENMIGYLVSGKFKETVGNETKTLVSGDSWYVPTNIEHESYTLEDSVLICVFSPPRKDYI
jgi:quercetin dioxygenase-like cupin family protein